MATENFPIIIGESYTGYIGYIGFGMARHPNIIELMSEKPEPDKATTLHYLDFINFLKNSICENVALKKIEKLHIKQKLRYTHHYTHQYSRKK